MMTKQNNKEQQSKEPKYSIYLPKTKFGIFRRFLISFLLISIIPIFIFGLYSIYTLNQLDNDITKKVKNTIDNKTLQELELQAIYTANAVNKFLKQREYDLRALSNLAPTKKNYLRFSKEHLSEIWIRTGTNKHFGEIHKLIPIYKEISFIDASGMEKVKVAKNKIVPGNELKNISIPKNTTYKSEKYFSETKKFGKGKIYVSHVTGFYVTRKEQLGSAAKIENAVEGKKYDGIIRFVLPVYRGKHFIGEVMLGVDHQHLMEFTQHILPINKNQTVFPVYSSGNYAFMFDDDGWTITHPKYWDIRGVDEYGKRVPSYKETTSKKDLEIGRIPFNLDDADFIHPNYPFVADEIRSKQSGTVITKNIGGVNKIMAYAPIVYSTGPYKKYGVFGGITIGTQLEQFQSGTKPITAEMEKIMDLFKKNITWFILLTFLAAAITSFFVSRNFTKPIIQLTTASENLADGKLDERIFIDRNDEIGTLASSFNFMAYELQKSKSDLLESLKVLELSKLKIESYAKDLEYQLKIFKTIQKISSIIGRTFDFNNVLKIILENSVKSIGFNRAILYLIDKSGKYLEYQEMFGFTADEEKIAKKSKYDILHFDCIETRTIKSGEIIFVENFNHYDKATDLDRKIRAISKSSSFVFVPLKAKEKIIGIMGADKLRSKEKITELDINSLQILANQASRVIENTQLYQDLIKERNFVEDVLRFMPSGVITIDNNFIITSLNKSASTIFNIKSSSAVGKQFWDVFNKLDNFISEFKKYFTDSKNKEFSFAIQQQIEDKLKYLEIAVANIKSEDKTNLGYIIIISDKTERKLIEDQLQQIERLALLGRFAAGIAHEIRNPLTGVSLFLDDLHDKVTSDKDIAGIIELALSEVERLEKLVNELLEYASPAKGNFSLNNLNEVIVSTINFLKSQFNSSDIKVKENLAPFIEPFIFDKEKLRQALLNIFINSIQAINKGGEVTISTEITKMESNINKKSPSLKLQNFVKISIEDTGTGLKLNEEKDIFEPFYTTKKGGTGLGLSITHTIISEHNGKIEARNNVTGGALFIIYLPYIKEHKV